MPAEICVPQIQACRLRFAKLLADGDIGTDQYTTKAFSRFNTTAVYTEGDEIEDKNACGEVESNFKSAATFKRLDGEITLLRQDPYLVAALSGGSVLTDGEAIGASYPALGTVDETTIFSLELWAKRAQNGALDPDYPYAWWVGPQIQNVRLGDKTFESGTQLTVISFEMVENPNWGTGPQDDWPVTSDRVLQWIPTDTLPAATCGLIATAPGV